MSTEIKKRIPREKLLEKVESIYKLVILAARRGLEISDGAPRLVIAPPKRKPGLIAMEEILEGKVTYKEKKLSKSKKS